MTFSVIDEQKILAQKQTSAVAKPIPDGFHSVTPTLTVKGASDVIEFYKKAFAAQEIYRFLGLCGKSICMHRSK